MKAIYHFRQLSSIEKRTFLLHLLHSFFEGAVWGVIALNEFVFLKSLEGSEILVSFLFSFSVIIFIFSIPAHTIIRNIRNVKKILIYLAVISRLPFVFIFFIPEQFRLTGELTLVQAYFMLMILLFYLGQPIFLPLLTGLLKSNYSKGFGRLYSYATTLNKIIVIVFTFLFGYWLDINFTAYRWMYPLTGILGVVALLVLVFIPVPEKMEESKVKRWKDIGKNSLMILKKAFQNRAFLDFEKAFMWYGFAFMSTAVIIILFYEKALSLNYTSIAFYKNLFNAVSILSLPLFGKWIDKLDPRRFASLTFVFFIFTLLFTYLSKYIRIEFHYLSIRFILTLVTANIFYGLFNSSMTLSWNIGSSYFCKPEEASEYQSVHLSMVGVRGLIFPFLGTLIFTHTGYGFVFGLGILFLIVAIWLMNKSVRVSPSAMNENNG